jgi:hypothetical protein
MEQIRRQRIAALTPFARLPTAAAVAKIVLQPSAAAAEVLLPAALNPLAVRRAARREGRPQRRRPHARFS